jgi:hypothetical protein
MRKLTPVEEKRLTVLTSKSVKVCLIETTATGLNKSIMDATMSLRNYLSDMDVHDYNLQKQGQEHKILLKANLINENAIIPSLGSLYRPNTKKGDPRIWFKGLSEFSSPNNIIALIIRNGEAFVMNLSKLPLVEIVEYNKPNPVLDLLNEINKASNSISSELLVKLKFIAQSGLSRSVMDIEADTAIGRTLETLLGIDMNSREKPDYKGIELKSYRLKGGLRGNRKTLFAQVPNWNISQFKNSKEILENFGYTRDSNFKLYCTVNALTKNSQGLKLELDSKEDQLIESSDKKEIGVFATWLMDDLRKKLIEKHNETFWVAAKTQMVNNHEHFQYTKVLHTRKPIASQFDILLEQGAITVDHLIKRTATGGAKEKGPLFKIDSRSLEMLFPPGLTYDLIA